MYSETQMLRRFFPLSLLPLLALTARLQAATPEAPMPEAPKPDSASINGVGAVVIFSQQPDQLAAWYANAFGLSTPVKQGGGHFGTIQSAAGPIQFGIMAFPPEMPVRPGGAVSVTFRVDNFPLYLATLKARGLTPLTVSDDTEGHFAFFTDPDGNGIAIWGQ